MNVLWCLSNVNSNTLSYLVKGKISKYLEKISYLFTVDCCTYLLSVCVDIWDKSDKGKMMFVDPVVYTRVVEKTFINPSQSTELHNK